MNTDYVIKAIRDKGYDKGAGFRLASGFNGGGPYVVISLPDGSGVGGYLPLDDESDDAFVSALVSEVSKRYPIEIPKPRITSPEEWMRDSFQPEDWRPL